MRAAPRSRYLVFFGIALGGCLVDLLTKQIMFRWLGMPGGPIYWVWSDVLGFQTSLNEGALFGIGQGQVQFFAFLSALAAVAIMVWLFVGGAAHDRLLTVSLALITGGILGNLYDRLGLSGLVWHYPSPHHAVGEPVHAVRDWALVMIGSWPWPNFNLADVMLDCGAVLLFGQALLSKAGNPEVKSAA